MPVERRAISVSQISELLGVDPARFIAVERLTSTMLQIVLEPEMNTTGTFPQLTKPGKKIGGGKKSG